MPRQNATCNIIWRWYAIGKHGVVRYAFSDAATHQPNFVVKDNTDYAKE
ncbi:MAG: hypothetical protein IPH52_05275 [Leptospiraceae bacterium]|nr:hypothetical protein [Leptospiraceae bacterium]MBK7054452.1 hypothetical protein [Leptospiraceae bacterium]